jgi:hypothetical protein
MSRCVPTVVAPTNEEAPKARIAFAEIGAHSLSRPFDQAIEAAIVPGLRETRYGREWRMGQYRRENGFLFGRIGFEAAGVTELWSDESNDFVAEVKP